AVRVVLAVARPRGAPGLPAETADELRQLAGVRADQLGVEARLAQLALHLAVGVAVLEPGVEDDVGEDAAPKPVATSQERAHLGGLDALERSPQPGLEGDVLVGLKH